MSDADSYLAFVGTYTDTGSEGLHRYRVDAATGDLDLLGTTPAGDNPTFLALHPDGEHLYAVNEVDGGSVTAFAIDRDAGELSRLNRRPCGDAGPCHCSVDATGSYVLTANYAGGSVSMLPIGDDGRVGEPADVVEHEGSGVDPDRQAAPHPHSITPGPDNRFAYVPDLGTDRVAVYELDLDGGSLVRASDASLHGGAGPRHLDFHPEEPYAYLINELDSTVTAFERDPRTGALAEIETVDTLPAGFDGENYTADIHVHPSGRFVYGSNRGHHSIVVFEIGDDGRLRTVDHESTRGEWPRNFALDPAGEFLFAENKNTDDIVVFRVDGDTGELSPTGHVTEVPQPSCLQFLPRR